MHAECRDAETVGKGVLSRLAAGIQTPAAFEPLPVCPQRSRSSGIITWVLCYSLALDFAFFHTGPWRTVLCYLPPAYKNLFSSKTFSTSKSHSSGRHVQQIHMDPYSVGALPWLSRPQLEDEEQIWQEPPPSF